MAVRSLLGALMAAALVAGCSSGTSEGVGGMGAGGSATGTTTAGGASPAPAYTLDNYCDKTAPLFCSAIQGCCEASLAFDAEGCETYYRENLCRAEVLAARQGLTTFTLSDMPDAEAQAQVDACFQAFAGFADTCEDATYYDRWAFDGLRIHACRPIFDGSSALDEPCARDRDCQDLGYPGVVRCFSGTCGQAVLWSAGSSCPTQQSACVEGFACTPAPEGGRRCQPTTPLGAPCLQEPLNPECGRGRHCDLAEGICKLAYGTVGDSCEVNERWLCKSTFCQYHQAGTCAHPIGWENWFGTYDHSLTRGMCGAEATP